MIMRSRLSLLLLFFLASACSLFRAPADLSRKEVSQLLGSIKITGEGRGRLIYDNSQNVFGFDAVLRQNTDWLLAVSIPLHGEEVMILPELNKEDAEGQMQAFEARIARALYEMKANISPKEFLQSLRSLMRFLMGEQVGAPVHCVREDEIICRQFNRYFVVSVQKNEITIVEREKKDFQVVVKARNLTDSFFQQTEFYLLSSEGRHQLLSLELFWK